MLQLHDHPDNVGDVVLSVELRDAAGGAASVPVTVGPTMPWLETTTPKSVFETLRVPLAAFEGVDVGRLTSVALVFDGSDTGRLVIDDLELSPGPRCVD
jgi:hypothetical protein